MFWCIRGNYVPGYLFYGEDNAYWLHLEHDWFLAKIVNGLQAKLLTQYNLTKFHGQQSQTQIQQLFILYTNGLLVVRKPAAIIRHLGSPDITPKFGEGDKAGFLDKNWVWVIENRLAISESLAVCGASSQLFVACKQFSPVTATAIQTPVKSVRSTIGSYCFKHGNEFIVYYPKDSNEI